MKKLLIIPVVCVALYGCNNSSQTGSDADTVIDSLTPIDTADYNSSEFINEALKHGAMEVELGQLAQKQGMNARVKAFGAMMVKDHTAAGNELKKIASKNNLTITTDKDDDHMEDVGELRKKTGVDFDKKYIKMMLSGHRKSIEKFEDIAKRNDNADLKSFAAKTLPTLKMHLDSAKSINKEVKASLDKNDISDAMERYPHH